MRSQSLRTTREREASSIHLPQSVFIFFISVCAINHLHAQTDIPIGTWRLHLSYNTIKTIAVAQDYIYAASESGVLVLDRDDHSILTYNTLNGLNATGITNIGYDQINSQLLIAYEEGSMDIIKDNLVINFNRLKNSTEISGSKKINHISMQNNFAYLSADYGVVVFDLQQNELKEIWRDLGPGGSSLKIFQSTILGDSIFLATEKGMLAGDLDDNLLNFNKWKRSNTGDLANPVHLVTTFNNDVYSAVNGFGIYQYNDGKWNKQLFLTGKQFNAMGSSAASLYIAESTNVWQINSTGSLSLVEDPLITFAIEIKSDNEGKIYTGDKKNGLVSNMSGSFNSYLPNGPQHSRAFRLKYVNRNMYALATNALAPGSFDNSNAVDFFSQGSWQTLTSSLTNITDVEYVNNNTYLASYGQGVEQLDNSGNRTIYNNSNSTLGNSASVGNSINATSLAAFGDELHVTTRDATASLHIFRNNTWQAFSFDNIPAAMYPVQAITDYRGNDWMIIDKAAGGGAVLRLASGDNSLYKTTATGSGALPSANVRTIINDRDGYIWVGTEEGVAYFFAVDQDAVKPIFDNRFLLRDEKVTAIAADGGNRKWIGTERGVWLFSPMGEKLIANFTSENSPLPSDVIFDIEIVHETGEVFFSTDKGIISFRADATQGDPKFRNLHIFPNPVTADFSGMVGIAGLATDAIVKITDIAGKLIWQAQANGGTVAWNVRDYNGNRAATGIYIVFAATADGAESVVGKIAVVD
jgi:hypothetical protein